jgi:hypothetical protein
VAPTYEEWNDALIEHVTCGVRKGSPVYLWIDERALLLTWRQLLSQTEGDLAPVRAAFAREILRKCSAWGGVISLDAINGLDGRGRPRCVAFLAAMVLAANDMEDDDEAGENNYYYRLRRVFDPSSTEHGEPEWLKDKYHERLDVPLWETWNRWLTEQDWEPTAREGGPNTKYINYPVSQSLLRKGDRERLAGLFRSQMDADQRNWDRDLLAAYLPDLAEHASSKRLRELLSDRDSDPLRYEAIADAAFGVYSSLDWSGGTEAVDVVRTLDAGLFRTEDRRGRTTYRLYPRVPQHWRGQASLVAHYPDGATEELAPDHHHVGRFLPLRRPIEHLADLRLNVLVEGRGERLTLALPGRDFWLLVADPDDEFSDALATWGLPALGEHFLLVCRPKHAEQLCDLLRLDLLGWQGDPREVFHAGTQWLEYYGCQVLRPSWGHVVPRRESRLLVETLWPRAGRLSLSFEGGLSVPGQNVWLEGHPPQMRVRAAAKEVQWCVRRRDSGAVVHPLSAGPSHHPIALPELPAGDYEVEVVAGEDLRRRRNLRIASWENLPSATPSAGFETCGKHFTLRGAHLLPECL